MGTRRLEQRRRVAGFRGKAGATRIVRPRRPAVEALEERQLLANGFNPFAQFSGTVGSPGGSDIIPLHVATPTFTLPGKRVLLGFAMQATNPSGPGSPTMTIAAPGHTFARKILVKEGAAGGTTALMLARVGQGTIDVQMGQTPGAMGPFQLGVFLVGDVNGDGKVDRTDLNEIRSLLGKTQNDPGFVLAADPDGDGRIGLRDLALARMNLGASTAVRPLAVSLAIDPASNPTVDGITIQNGVTVDGHTVPGAFVSLDQGAKGSISQITTADALGAFHFSLTTPVGTTPLLVTATDRFGQQATATLSIKHGDAVIAWNETTLEAIRADKTSLGLATRTMAMVQAAVYDAVNDIERTSSVYHVDVAAPAGASPVAAASAAAYDVLLSIYPHQQALFNATLADTLSTVLPGKSLTDGVNVGLAVAQGILAWRQNDGSSFSVPYIPGTQPGQWRPTPPDFSAPWGPEWGAVTPFAIPDAAQFQPPPPPPLNSPAYTAAFNEVKSLGALNSTTRTPFQTQTAYFWAYDAPPLGPPPLLYDQIAQTIALQEGNSLEQNARMFALVNIAMVDAGIVAWDAKYTDNFWRPVTAIPLAGSDGNPSTIADPNWVPLGAPGNGLKANFTPPFPAYVSGHATFGAAMFQTLADFYGTDNIHFTIGSDQLPGVYHTFNSFSAAAEENGQSRIYLGIHWAFDKTEGIATGDKLANYVYQHILTPAS
jgi:hypothetical protein